MHSTETGLGHGAPRPACSTLSDPGATGARAALHPQVTRTEGDLQGGAGPAHRPPCRSPSSKGRLHLPSSSLTLQKMPKAERGRDSDSGRRQEEPPGCRAETCACPGLPDHAGDPGPTRVGSAGGPASCSSGPTGPGAACRVLDQRPRLPGELGPPSGRPMSSCPVTARQQGLLGRTSVGARAHELTASLGAGWLGTRARGGSLSGHFPVSNSHCNIICDPKRRPWGPRASEFSVRSLPRAGGGCTGGPAVGTGRGPLAPGEHDRPGRLGAQGTRLRLHAARSNAACVPPGSPRTPKPTQVGRARADTGGQGHIPEVGTGR